MRVLGIDCGTEYTGYGIVDLLDDERLVCVTCGAIKVSPREPMPTRLSRISVGLHELICEHRPDRDSSLSQARTTRMLRISHLSEIGPVLRRGCRVVFHSGAPRHPALRRS